MPLDRRAAESYIIYESSMSVHAMFGGIHVRRYRGRRSWLKWNRCATRGEAKSGDGRFWRECRPAKPEHTISNKQERGVSHLLGTHSNPYNAQSGGHFSKTVYTISRYERVLYFSLFRNGQFYLFYHYTHCSPYIFFFLHFPFDYV